MKTRLLVLEDKRVFDRYSQKEIHEECNVTIMDQFSTVEEIVTCCSDAEILLVNPTISVTRALIDSLPNLRLIQAAGVGFEGIDLKEASKRGIFVCNCKGVNSRAVAEHTVMLMLCCLCDLINGHKAVLEGKQNDKKVYSMQSGTIRELGDCTVGIIGLGAVGEEVARLTQAFGAKTIYYKRNPSQSKFAEYRNLDELLAESDIVSLNLPLTKETENMADISFFNKMKHGAILINTARGGLVKSVDLIDAIASGKLSAAGLDVLDHEPVQKDHILTTSPEAVRNRIVFTPHIAGASANAFKRTFDVIFENIMHVKNSERPINVVNEVGFQKQ